MNKLTYKQAFDKITEAYIRGEIQPYKSNFCFCGTIAPEEYSAEGFKNWNNHDGKFDQAKHFYTLAEYGKMERALFYHLGVPESDRISYGRGIEKSDEGYEDALFNGMVAALEVLKQIHKDRGENVEDFQFTKREPA